MKYPDALKPRQMLKNIFKGACVLFVVDALYIRQSEQEMVRTYNTPLDSPIIDTLSGHRYGAHPLRGLFSRKALPTPRDYAKHPYSSYKFNYSGQFIADITGHRLTWGVIRIVPYTPPKKAASISRKSSAPIR